MLVTFGSLFAGIGGMDLGLERARMTCKWQVEIDDYATKILERHWPNVIRYQDVRDCGAHNLKPVDLICGGFPCQDISNAGKRAGIKGKQSGLWSEFHRIICELRPKYVLVENVSALLVRGMGTVLGDLAKSGYDAEWQSLPASALGAPHGRDRLFIVAYSPLHRSRNENQGTVFGANQGRTFSRMGYGGSLVGRRTYASSKVAWNNSTWQDNGGRQVGALLVGVVDGVPHRVDRLKTLGNAVVPQVAEWIGQQIMALDK